MENRDALGEKNTRKKWRLLEFLHLGGPGPLLLAPAALHTRAHAVSYQSPPQSEPLELPSGLMMCFSGCQPSLPIGITGELRGKAKVLFLLLPSPFRPNATR